MEIIYEGVDITSKVSVAAAAALDASDGRVDNLDISFDGAAKWQGWAPQADDRIQILESGYDSGEMYINAVLSEEGQYRILASAAKTKAFYKGNEDFRGKRLEKIMEICAAECGMDWRLYGISGSIVYPYALRCGQGPAAFLSGLARQEGCALKVYAGRFTMISIAAAQALAAVQSITVTAEQKGARYTRKIYEKAPKARVVTPWAEASATDTAVNTGRELVIGGGNARDAVSAGRMARGLLLWHNRQAERLDIDLDLQPGWTAMGRIDVIGSPALAGEWIIDSLRHDLKKKTTSAALLRCIDTIG